MLTSPGGHEVFMKYGTGVHSKSSITIIAVIIPLVLLSPSDLYPLLLLLRAQVLSPL